MDNIIKAGSREKIKKSIISELSISPSDAEKVFDYLAAAYQENTAEFGRIDQSTAMRMVNAVFRKQILKKYLRILRRHRL